MTHVIIFKELGPQEKAQYVRFLIENNVKFAKRPVDGRYIANIRLVTPSQSPTTIEKTIPVIVTDQSQEEEVADPYKTYQHFIQLFEHGSIINRSPSGVYSTSKATRLLRFLDIFYDALTKSTHGIDMCSQSPDFFARAVYTYLAHRFGVQSIIEQQACDLLQGLINHSHLIEIQLFSKFLHGNRYNSQTVAFFLHTRQIILHESRSKIHLTWSQVERVTRIVFDNQEEQEGIFLHAVRVWMRCQNPTPLNIPISVLYTLIVDKYVEIQQEQEETTTVDSSPSPLPPPPQPRGSTSLPWQEPSNDLQQRFSSLLQRMQQRSNSY